MSELVFGAETFLRPIEGGGLGGSWSWIFAANTQFWSPGFYRLLGLASGHVRPSYDLFLSLIHPEDRISVPTTSELLLGNVPQSYKIRLICPDGTRRELSAWNEVHCTPDGQPMAVVSTVLDVTDRERLSRLQRAEADRRRHLYAMTRTLQFTLDASMRHIQLPQEVAVVSGRLYQELVDDPFAGVVPGERERLRERAEQHKREKRIFQDTTTVLLSHGRTEQVRILGVPVFDDSGTFVGGYGLCFPVDQVPPALPQEIRLGLENAIQAYHIRSARALLGWSMENLAKASGLSLSSVRRLEDDSNLGIRSRNRVIAALRKAGIYFVVLDGGCVAIARR